MRYLITGGAGFIGSHIADALVQQGYAGAVLDNLSSVHRRNLVDVQEKSSFTEGDKNNFLYSRGIGGCDSSGFLYPIYVPRTGGVK